MEVSARGMHAHTHIHASSLAHTTCLTSWLAQSPPLFPCPAASFAPLLPLLSPNPIIDEYDYIFISLTHADIVESSFPHVKSWYFSHFLFNPSSLYYAWTLFDVQPNIEHANISA